MDTDQQIEMMMQMQNVENHPDFSHFVNLIYSNNHITSSTHLPQIMNNPHLNPQTFNNQSTISFSQSLPVTDPAISTTSTGEFYGVGNTWPKKNSMEQMREMIFRMSVMQPIHIDPESVKAPKRRNVKISKDPQSVAARQRRERISERIRILQRIVPGGTKLDTASMLDEAIHYVKFLKSQVELLEREAANRTAAGMRFPVGMCSGVYGGSSENSYQTSGQSVHQPYLDI